MNAHVDVRPAAQRFHTKIDWLDSWHSFSFANHRDPANTHHGLLVVHNDDVIAPGSGFGMHPHRDMEIVTWVLSGRLEHHDSAGNHGVIYPGLAQRMSAGRGILHSETNPSRDEPVHLVQMWVLPDVHGIAPEYEQRDVSDALAVNELIPVASGQGHGGAILIHQHDAVLYAGRLSAGTPADLPPSVHAHVFVAAGSATIDADELHEGDAVRLTDAGPKRLVAGPQGAEILAWITA